MTPKEKAEQLIETFRMNVLDYEGCGINDHKAKQCALIAVDEIYKLRMTRGQHLEYDLDKINYYSYWEEVRQEIVEQQIKSKMNTRFRKKPVEIEALKFTRENWQDVLMFTEGQAHTLTIEKRIDGKCTCIIPTLEGQHIANEGDWIIKGVQGEYYPCKPDIFEMTYDRVGGQDNE